MSTRILQRYLLAQLLPSRKVGHSKTAIDLSVKLPTLWYENQKGDVWELPDPGPLFIDPPPGFIYQHSRFPRTLIENVLRLTTPGEVAACPHEETLIDHGLISSHEGRMCRRCGGHQSKLKGTPWPAEWSSTGSRPAWTGTSSYPADIVLAMVRPTPEEQDRARERGYAHPPQPYEHAVLLTATACGRCLNVLSWQFGRPDEDGFDENTPEWVSYNTSCSLCT